MEELGMARQSKRDYLRSIHKRYRQARRQEKSAMLEEFARICGYNRKYAIWLLKRPLPQSKAHRRRGKRSVTYSQGTITTLAKVWEASGYLCSQRLKAALPQWLPWVKKHFDISKELERQLLRISPRQMDRRLFPHKRAAKRRLYGTTRPGSLLKHMIPVKTDHWDVTLPGYLEIDLVSHSGRSAVGEFIYTLDCVDVATGWVERQAVMGKGQLAIVDALREIEQRLPFALRGIDSDNGSEFINTHLFNFCQQRPQDQSVQFTRSRPYKKDDNAHVEQKNWTHVRQCFGYERHDKPELVEPMNMLVKGAYGQLLNYFHASLKLEHKERKEGKVRRLYGAAQTPLARVLASAEVSEATKARLVKHKASLNPFALKQTVTKSLKAISALRRGHR